MKNIIIIFLILFFLQVEVRSDSFTLDFSDYNYYDSANTSAFWNIGLQAVQAYGVYGDGSNDRFNLGNGSDGVCLFTGALTSKTYNCITTTFQGNVSFSGSDPIIIRSLGDVNINGLIDVSGESGSSGLAIYGNIIGGSGGPAGGKGGDWLEDDPLIHGAKDGENGESVGLNGAGRGGIKSGAFSGGTGGGGGGGASYGVTLLGGPGVDGGDDDILPDTGGAGGTRGQEYGGQQFFRTSLVGGSGGGAGGSGDDTANFWSSGSGGGGGGAIRIITGGNIIIATGGGINANGGDGGDGLTYSGGGGGGSGGAIFLQAQKQIDLQGTAFLSALGGAGGNGGGTKGGNGGNGGDGRILLEDQDGIISANVNPDSQFPSSTNPVLNSNYSSDTVYLQTLSYDTGYEEVEYQSVSTVDTLNGGTIFYNLADSSDGANWNDWVDEANVSNLSERYIRVRAEISPSSTESTPIIDSITVNYARLVIPPTPTPTPTQTSPTIKNYNSKFGCGLFTNHFNEKLKSWKSLLSIILGILFIGLIYKFIRFFKVNNEY